MYSNLPQKTKDLTLQAFGEDTDSKTFVTDNVNDALVGFFEQRTANKESAAALSAAVLIGAKAQQVSVMELIDHLSTLSNSQLDEYIALFLNSTRVGTSLLGVNNQPMASYYVRRTILS